MRNITKMKGYKPIFFQVAVVNSDKIRKFLLPRKQTIVIPSKQKMIQSYSKPIIQINSVLYII